jgi:hypothetical protein
MWIIFYNYTIEGGGRQLSILTVASSKLLEFFATPAAFGCYTCVINSFPSKGWSALSDLCTEQTQCNRYG